MIRDLVTKKELDELIEWIDSGDPIKDRWGDGDDLIRRLAFTLRDGRIFE